MIMESSSPPRTMWSSQGDDNLSRRYGDSRSVDGAGNRALVSQVPLASTSVRIDRRMCSGNRGQAALTSSSPKARSSVPGCASPCPAETVPCASICASSPLGALANCDSAGVRIPPAPLQSSGVSRRTRLIARLNAPQGPFCKGRSAAMRPFRAGLARGAEPPGFASLAGVYAERSNL
jgi:hypothetical protein